MTERHPAEREERLRRAVGAGPAPLKSRAAVTEAVTNGFSIGTSAQKILPANRNRSYILIQNRGSASIYLSFKSAPDLNNANVHEIPAGGNFETGFICPVSDLYIVAAVANTQVAVTEGTKQ